MLNDILRPDQLPDFQTDKNVHQFYDLDTESDHNLMTIGFHSVFVTVVACK